MKPSLLALTCTILGCSNGKHADDSSARATAPAPAPAPAPTAPVTPPAAPSPSVAAAPSPSATAAAPSPSAAAAPSPSAAAAPAPAAASWDKLYDAPAERLAADDATFVFGGGRAQVALVAREGAHGPVVVRALVDDKRVDLFTVATGDCGGATITELSGAGDVAIAVLGQSSYTDCDDDNAAVRKADIDSHVECARLTWSPAAGKIDVQRSKRVSYQGDLPAWCKDTTAAAPTAGATGATGATP